MSVTLRGIRRAPGLGKTGRKAGCSYSIAQHNGKINRIFLLRRALQNTLSQRRRRGVPSPPIRQAYRIFPWAINTGKSTPGRSGRTPVSYTHLANEAGEKEVSGILKGKQGTAVTLVRPDGTQAVVDVKDASFFKLCDDEDLFG